ncbi:MAG TPA: polysaccharide deacetylase family protein [Solirubrobacteraceae bacterium]|nr:polysaccharide deacetylase family protein [Solirubrobacteraceae bacterium]
MRRALSAAWVGMLSVVVALAALGFDPGVAGSAPRGGARRAARAAAGRGLRAPAGGAAGAKQHTPRLVGCVARGPSVVHGGSSRVHDIALTFDDGPWYQPPTIDFVKLLAREHVPATFFEIGRQISGYDPTGSVERAMLAAGDTIGDHTWDHPNMAALGAARQRSELELTIAAIRRATGFTPCLWRPPYGDISPELISLARSLGLLTILWNIDPRDWALPGVNAIVNNVAANARNGGIVEEHFGGGPRYETLAALPREIAGLRARGYRFVTVAELLGLRMVSR